MQTYYCCLLNKNPRALVSITLYSTHCKVFVPLKNLNNFICKELNA